MTAGTDSREDEWRITPHLSASAALMWCVCLPWGIIGEPVKSAGPSAGADAMKRVAFDCAV